MRRTILGYTPIVAISLVMIVPAVNAAQMSQEMAIRKVRQAYCRVLERSADQSGLVAYAPKLQSGEMTVQELVRTLAKSTEHRDRFYWNRRPEEFAKVLLDHILAPAPTTAQERSDAQRHVYQTRHLIYNKGAPYVIDWWINMNAYKWKWGTNKVPGRGRRGCK